MRFVTQTTGLAEVLAKALGDALDQNNRVVWLIPGGSNIEISVKAMRLLDESLTSKLVIMQTDERYLKLSSPDCNWYQLKTAGLDLKQATPYPILLDDNESILEATKRYHKTIQEQFDSADYIIGQFGIGADGHTAGIKPNSEAANSKQFVAGYQAEDFSRITMTFPAISRLNAAYTFAFGSDKKSVLGQLKSSDKPLETIPAGVLKKVPISILYNDQV